MKNKKIENKELQIHTKENEKEKIYKKEGNFQRKRT